jgi:hypothetical protein
MSCLSLHHPDVIISDAGGFGVHTRVEFMKVFRATAADNVRFLSLMHESGWQDGAWDDRCGPGCSAGVAEGWLRWPWAESVALVRRG